MGLCSGGVTTVLSVIWTTFHIHLGCQEVRGPDQPTLNCVSCFQTQRQDAYAGQRKEGYKFEASLSYKENGSIVNWAGPFLCLLHLAFGLLPLVCVVSHSLPLRSWPSRRTKGFLNFRGLTSTRGLESLCCELESEEGWSLSLRVTQLLCSLFSFGRTSFLQKDCPLWRRRSSCVKASRRPWCTGL